MKNFNYRIFVNFKNGVVDPQGESVKKVLSRSGYRIKKVEFGKVINVTIEAEGKPKADEIIKEIAENIFANPVLENFSISFQGEEK